ncbi:hypothetical protein [Aliivibrio kagoshimensis]|uniref:hypothetical protein n=1 Tax=Aliivibrio kagoshimensis TaxID=2910230 RepID=UPI003D0CBA6A
MSETNTPISPKQDLLSLCKEIAKEFEGWSYTAGTFKYKSLKHTELQIKTFWSFNGLRGTIAPAVCIKNKKIEKLYHEITGEVPNSWDWTFLLHHEQQRPEKYHSARYHIFRHRNSMGNHGWEKYYLTLEQAPEFIRAVLQDGIDIIEQQYHLDSERTLLGNLPEEYHTVVAGTYCQLYEEGEGIKYCLARILLGDFDYVERYYRDEIKTVQTKCKEDLEKILAVLPELKKRDFKVSENLKGENLKGQTSDKKVEIAAKRNLNR